MNLIQFLRILAARRAIILATLLASFLTALVISQLLPPRYEAKSRVLLDVVRPDPVTGLVLSTNNQYIRTQMELIKDHRTAGMVVDKLGWASEPTLAAEFAESGSGGDLRRWLAQRIIDNTEPNMLGNSNILEITYTGTAPESARVVADLVRDTFVELSLASRRENARRTADWYREQTDKALVLLTAAEGGRSEFAKANGIILQADNSDLESKKLEALSQATTTPMDFPAMSAAAPSPSRMQLDQIDQQLAQAATTLGPNHPVFQSLQRQRRVIEAEVGRSSGGGGFSRPGASAAQIEQNYQRQKSRVLSQRDKIDRLSQMQRDIEIKRDQYLKSAQRAAELRLEAEVGETELSPLGNAPLPRKPSFPNMPLIMIGSIGLGAAIGICLALLVEMLGRRIRSDADLEHAASAPVLAVVGRRRNPDGLVSRVMRFVDRRSSSRDQTLAEA